MQHLSLSSRPPRRRLLGKVAMVLIGSIVSLVADQNPLAAEVVPWTPELAMSVKRIGSVQVSPDGKQAACTVRSAVMEADKSEYLTHIHLATTDGKSVSQLTRGDKSCDDPQWSPNGEWIAFVTARVGKKNLWLIRPAGGEAHQLTVSKTDITSFKWSPDSSKIAFTANEPPTADDDKRELGKDDARVIDETFKRQQLFVTPITFQRRSDSIEPHEVETGLETDMRAFGTSGLHVVSDNRPGRAAFDWSPDSRTIVFTHTNTSSQDDWPSASLALADVTTGKVRSLVNSAAAETSPLYSPDGMLIAYLQSNTPASWAGLKTVQVIPSDGGPPKALAEMRDGGGRYTELVGWSEDGRQIYFTEAHGTNLQLLGLPLEGTPVAISDQTGMSNGGVSLNTRRTHFGFGWEQLDRAPEAFVTSVAEFAPTKISEANVTPMPAIGETQVIRWKSTDGLEIEGLLTYPWPYEKSQRYPLLLVVHGGPMGVFTQSFDGTAGTYPVGVFSSEGYAVLRVNVRGSSGYGAKFRHANYGDWGGGDYQDLMTGVDHVIKMGVADPDRLGVMGWSYGGFMTSWIITQTKRFKAASVGAGVTNLMSFTGTADIPSFLPDYFAGEFWDKPEVYAKHSAMFQIKGVTTPTLVQHGEKDERVPLSQGQELYNALKRQGCKTKMVIYPRTPHGIEEPKLLLDCMERNVEWFATHILQSAPVVSGPRP